MSWATYSSETYDELLGSEGRPRAAARRVGDFIAALGTDELQSRQRAAVGDIRSRASPSPCTPSRQSDRAWPFDVIPRVIDAGEWAASSAASCSG